MDESVIKHLEQPQVGTLKLSEAIRIGCSWVKESHLFSGCAIGTAYKVRTGEDLTDAWLSGYRSHRLNPSELVARAFSVPVGVVEHVSAEHFRDVMTREQAADWLAAQGY